MEVDLGSVPTLDRLFPYAASDYYRDRDRDRCREIVILGPYKVSIDRVIRFDARPTSTKESVRKARIVKTPVRLRDGPKGKKNEQGI